MAKILNPTSWRLILRALSWHLWAACFWKTVGFRCHWWFCTSGRRTHQAVLSALEQGFVFILQPWRLKRVLSYRSNNNNNKKNIKWWLYSRSWCHVQSSINTITCPHVPAWELVPSESTCPRAHQVTVPPPPSSFSWPWPQHQEGDLKHYKSVCHSLLTPYPRQSTTGQGSQGHQSSKDQHVTYQGPHYHLDFFSTIFHPFFNPRPLPFPSWFATHCFSLASSHHRMD